MTQQILLRKHWGALRPSDPQSEQYVRERLKAGEVVRAEIKRVRNPRQHRLYWALVNLVHEHQTRYATPQQLHAALKCAVGYADEIEGKHGERILIPKSISFGNMPQDEFEAFFERVLQLVCQKIIPGTKDDDLRRELESMVGD